MGKSLCFKKYIFTIANTKKKDFLTIINILESLHIQISQNKFTSLQKFYSLTTSTIIFCSLFKLNHNKYNVSIDIPVDV